EVSRPAQPGAVTAAHGESCGARVGVEVCDPAEQEYRVVNGVGVCEADQVATTEKHGAGAADGGPGAEVEGAGAEIQRCPRSDGPMPVEPAARATAVQ